ncbi:MAG: hypothetical protein BMS9Abin36_1711 [Gammaproteobacteria bacterium]|nr:MAG: hypothetical protein BMS9Abin36_1711 [Gammaproteobacteria bacterium]
MSRNLRSLSARHIDGKTLFEALSEQASTTGSLTDDQLRSLSRERLFSGASLLATGSFYDFLKRENRGKQAYLCTGTSCLLSGQQKHAHDVLKREFPEQAIGKAVCLGHCYCSGAYQIGERIYDAENGAVSAGGSETIPVYSHTTSPMLTDHIGDITALYELALMNRAGIIEALQASGLRGRGGAGFPFATKLAACAQEPEGQKYIVCNGDEGDPGAFSDRYLMEQQCHRLLAGMLAAGLAAGSDSGFIYIRAEYPLAVQKMAEAIDAYNNTDIFSRIGFQFRIIRGAGSYICGEETALLNSIEGLRPEVRMRPPYPAQEGLYGKPTLVSNVETFACIPWILANSGRRFASIGTGKSTGTKLVCLDNGFVKPGIHEVDMGTSFETVIHEFGGGFRRPTKAVQVGGPLGSVVPVDRISDLSLDFESFHQAGFSLGHAGIVAIPRDFAMLDFLRHLFRYMAEESCGKCLPCRLGTEKGYRMLAMATARQPLDRAAFNDLLQVLEAGSLCGLGAGLPLPVRNILTYFDNELVDTIK